MFHTEAGRFSLDELADASPPARERALPPLRRRGIVKLAYRVSGLRAALQGRTKR